MKTDYQNLKNLKAGDKVYCINSRFNMHKQNNFYKIAEIRENHILITSDDKSNYKSGVYSYRIKYDSLFQCFDDYFITIKELRKQKLEKLKSS